MKDVETIKINDKEYFLVDSIIKGENKYHYFLNENYINDIYILKDKIENGEKYFVSLDTENEFNQALILFYQKHKDELEEATN